MTTADCQKVPDFILQCGRTWYNREDETGYPGIILDSILNDSIPVADPSLIET